MKTFTRSNIQELNEKIEEALSIITDELGVKFKIKKNSYSPSNATIQIEAITEGSKSTEQSDYLAIQNLNPKLPKLGSEITIHGQLFKITGYKRKNFKYPILAESNGKVYKLAISSVEGL